MKGADIEVAKEDTIDGAAETATLEGAFETVFYGAHIERLRFMLSADTTVRIKVRGDFGPAEIERLIEALQIQLRWGQEDEKKAEGKTE